MQNKTKDEGAKTPCIICGGTGKVPQRGSVPLVKCRICKGAGFVVISIESLEQVEAIQAIRSRPAA